VNTAARRTPSGVLVLAPVAQAIDAIRHEAAQVRGLRNAVEEEWGRSESLDPDNVGDIADEGAGHRG
jgi:hypothetical protein